MPLAGTVASVPLVPTRRDKGLPALAAQANRFSWLWTSILIIVLVDSLWNFHAQLQFTGWSSVFEGLTFLVAGFVFYTVKRPNRRLADACHFTALWVIFSLAGVILTYLAASLSMPLRDLQLSRMDARLGFDWLSYHTFVFAHPVFHIALWIAYASLLPQVIGSTLYFAMTDRPQRNTELLATAILSALVTTALFACVPALGPYPTHTDYYPVLIGLREGIKRFSLDNVQGIITMPSYHAALAVILIYVHRPANRLFFPVLILNGLMVLSIPEGHHYFVDILAGIAIAVASIYVIARFSSGQFTFEHNQAPALCGTGSHSKR